MWVGTGKEGAGLAFRSFRSICSSITCAGEEAEDLSLLILFFCGGLDCLRKKADGAAEDEEPALRRIISSIFLDSSLRRSRSSFRLDSAAKGSTWLFSSLVIIMNWSFLFDAFFVGLEHFDLALEAFLFLPFLL